MTLKIRVRALTFRATVLKFRVRGGLALKNRVMSETLSKFGSANSKFRGMVWYGTGCELVSVPCCSVPSLLCRFRCVFGALRRDSTSIIVTGRSRRVPTHGTVWGIHAAKSAISV